MKAAVFPRLLPLMILLAVPGGTWSQSPGSIPPSRGEALVSELGCMQCHTDLAGPTPIREQAPDLGQAGLRYRPAYLLDFLQNPRAIRRHLGRARMPSFHLTEGEGLALTLYLGSLRPTPATNNWPDLPAGVLALIDQPIPKSSTAEFERELRETGTVESQAGAPLACLTCHTWQGRGGPLGPELEEAGLRLQPAWIVRYLMAPEQFGVPAPLMPAQFYRLSADRRQFESIRPDADRKLAIVVGSLAAAAPTRAAALEAQLERARKTHPGATIAAGERLFHALNCAACHRHPTIAPRPNAAPELASIGRRVQPDWLTSYLRKPVALRRAGYHPGDGSRMPDFRLQENEVAPLTSYLSAQRKPFPRLLSMASIASNAPPSAFAQAKAQTFLETKLSCLGCHRLEGKGGVIAPDLSRVKTRLQPDYIRAIIAQPKVVAPHAIMPKIPLTPATVDLLTRHLLHGNWVASETNAYLSPLEYPSLAILGSSMAAPQVTPIRSIYLRSCAGCHGAGGGADGFNAAFLQPARPANFTDRNSMASRPDDTLFDGIHSGGAILNRSHWMPAWGETFTPQEIRGLVRQLREFCSCEGPAWSRDGTPTAPSR